MFVSRFTEAQKQISLPDQDRDFEQNNCKSQINNENHQNIDLQPPGIFDLKKAISAIASPQISNFLRSPSNKNSQLDQNKFLATPSSSISRLKPQNQENKIFSLKSQKIIRYTSQGYMKLTKKERIAIIDQNQSNFLNQNLKKQKKFEKKQKKNHLNFLKGVAVNGSILSQKSPQNFDFEVKKKEEQIKIELNSEIYSRVMNLKNIVKGKYEKCFKIIDDMALKEAAQNSLKNIMIDDQLQVIDQSKLSQSEDINTVNMKSSKIDDSRIIQYQEIQNQNQKIKIVQNKHFEN